MLVDSGDDSWVYSADALANKSGPCTLREAVEAWRFARGIQQSTGIVHPNLNACETQNGAMGATGQDTIVISQKVKEIKVNTNHSEGSISLSYIPKYKASSATADAVPVQTLLISTQIGKDATGAPVYTNVQIVPMPGVVQSGSLFVMNGGGDQINPNSNAYYEKLSVTFAGFTFQNSNLVGGGGVIRAQMAQVAELIIDQCIFRNNVVSSTNGGDANGAAVSATGGFLGILSSFFEGNTAVKGGALDIGTSTGWEARPATSDSPAFASQEAAYVIRDSGFLHDFASVDGGAIHCRENVKVAIVGSNFEGNRANAGGAIDSKCGLSIADSVFLGNVAIQDGGGALYARSSSPGVRQLKNVVMRWNTAGENSQLCDPQGKDCVGGAVLAESDIACIACVLSDNTSYGTQGGGALAMRVSGVADPQVQVINTLVSNNKVVLSGGSDAPSVLLTGAAVAMLGTSDQWLVVIGSTIINNPGYGQIDGAFGSKSNLDVKNSILVTSDDKEVNCTGYVQGSALSVQSLQNNDGGADTCPDVKGEARNVIDMKYTGAQGAYFSGVVGNVPGLADVNALGVYSAYPSMFHFYFPNSGPAFGAGQPLYCTEVAFSNSVDLLGDTRAKACTLGAIENAQDIKEGHFFGMN